MGKTEMRWEIIANSAEAGRYALETAVLVAIAQK
jgi:hypothetical protein